MGLSLVFVWFVRSRSSGGRNGRGIGRRLNTVLKDVGPREYFPDHLKDGWRRWDEQGSNSKVECVSTV